MMLVLDTVVPVFAIAAVGYVWAAYHGEKTENLGRIAMLVAAPCLIFQSLSQTTMDASGIAALAGGAVCIASGTGLLAWTIGWRFSGRKGSPSHRGFVMPATFWNAGNMALPVCAQAFGPAGLEAATVIFITVTLLQSTGGTWIAKGSGGWLEMLRLPLFYAGLAGVVVAWTKAPVPTLIAVPVGMLADATIPLMLLNLGIQLRRLRITELEISLIAVLIRMGGGLAFAYAFVTIAGVEGGIRSVLLLSAAMPPAVINSVFAERYGTEPRLVASAIVLGTMISVVGIPIGVALLT